MARGYNGRRQPKRDIELLTVKNRSGRIRETQREKEERPETVPPSQRWVEEEVGHMYDLPGFLLTIQGGAHLPSHNEIPPRDWRIIPVTH